MTAGMTGSGTWQVPLPFCFRNNADKTAVQKLEIAREIVIGIGDVEVRVGIRDGGHPVEGIEATR